MTPLRLSCPVLLSICTWLSLGACSEPDVVAEGAIPVLDADGIGRNLAGLEGKPLLVNLWATWCPPCLAEMPALVEVHETVRNAGGELVGVNLDMLDERFDLTDQIKKVEGFVDRRGISFPVWVWEGGNKAAVFAALGIDDPGGIPATLAIDAKGKVLEVQIGQVDLERLEELFELARGDG